MYLIIIQLWSNVEVDSSCHGPTKSTLNEAVGRGECCCFIIDF
jgi:hypothetical protein